MLSKLPMAENAPIDLIFLDTLYHFQETLNLVSRVQERYPKVKLHIYKPQDAETPEEFSARYGEQLWETDDDRYDFIAKVEPAQRAYAELGVRAVLTGRRRSQGGKRGDLDIIEIDDAGMIKINPLANWSFGQVKKYVDEHNVPYNALLDQGYKSVGDWHSTQPVKEGEDERAGRWAGKEKSECGIHNKRSVYAQYLEELERKEREAMAAMNDSTYGEGYLIPELASLNEESVIQTEDEAQTSSTDTLVAVQSLVLDNESKSSSFEDIQKHSSTSQPLARSQAAPTSSETHPSTEKPWDGGLVEELPVASQPALLASEAQPLLSKPEDVEVANDLPLSSPVQEPHLQTLVQT